MCSYLSKCETESSVAMKRLLKKTRTLIKKKNEKSSHSFFILPELWLRKTFPAVTFANTNLPEKRYRICKSEKKLKELPEDSIDAFKKII